MSRGLSAALQAQWWRPRPGIALWPLLPLAWFYAAVMAARTAWYGLFTPKPLGPRVIVVGNLVVGGAGKTPTVIALVQWLLANGWHPGVISRGYGRTDDNRLVDVGTSDAASACGDEPLLIRRRTGVPVVVSRDRRLAGETLCRHHPEVDVIVSDDGLQHLRLPRDLNVIVFDQRGVGNGWVLPVGPLRQRFAAHRVPPRSLVLYNAEQPSTAWPGAVAQRRPLGAVALHDWQESGVTGARPLETLRGRHLLAVAGMADPCRFFRTLEGAGLQFDTLPLPDHAPFNPLPWPADAAEVVLTEKDAVKLPPARSLRAAVWVVALDFSLPAEFTLALCQRLGAAPNASS